MIVELSSFSKGAVDALAKLLSSVEQKPLCIVVVQADQNQIDDLIIDTVSQVLNVAVYKLTSNTRKREAVDARYIIVSLLLEFYPLMTLEEIGHKIGNRHHSTVINARTIIEDLLLKDKPFIKKHTACRSAVLELLIK